MNDNKEALNLILGLSSEEGRLSTLQLTLEQARHLIGYDKEKRITRAGYYCRKLRIKSDYNAFTEDIADFAKDDRPEDEATICDAFSALIMYLIALDQLSNLFS